MDILQLFIADVVPVAELEVVIVHAECRAEKVAHVGGTPAGKVDVVCETECGFLVDPLYHRTVPAHHAVHVPVGGTVVKGHLAECLDGHVKACVGLPLSVLLACHVGGADEKNVGVGVCLLDGLNLAGDNLLGPFDVAGVRSRNEVAAVFHDDEAGVHRLVRFREKFRIDAVENRARRSAHGDVVNGDTVGAVSRDGVDFCIAGKVHLGDRGRVLEFPGVDLQLVERFDDGFACVDHLGRALFFRIAFFVFTDDFHKGLVHVELRLEVRALVHQDLDGAVAAHMAEGILAFLALLDRNRCFAF